MLRDILAASISSSAQVSSRIAAVMALLTRFAGLETRSETQGPAPHCEGKRGYPFPCGYFVPTQHALRIGLDRHFAEKQSIYAGPGTRLMSLHAEPIRLKPDEVTSYAMKAIENFRFDYDHLLILPRVWSELTSDRQAA
jgi:hypothetical protein